MRTPAGNSAGESISSTTRLSWRRTYRPTVEGAAVELVHGGEREGVDDAEVVGELVGRHRVGREGAQVGEGGSGCVGPDDDEGDAELAHEVVVARGDGHL